MVAREIPGTGRLSRLSTEMRTRVAWVEGGRHRDASTAPRKTRLASSSVTSAD
jgi:hypothetical protein